MRLIDADAFDKMIEDAEVEAHRIQKYVFASALNTIRGNLREFPTAESIVYCSECANNYSTPHNPMCDYMDAHLYPNSFCSYGKRKGEGNDKL